MKLFAFQAGNDNLGIPPSQVVRIVESVPITPVPLMPPCYLGLIYHRGELFDVVDVNCLLYLGTAVARNQPRIILTKWSDRRLALVPDRILGLVWPATNSPDAGSPKFDHHGSGKSATTAVMEVEKPPRLLNLDALWESLETWFHGSG